MPKIMSIDIETYSSVDLNECGVYKYVESEDFDILLFAYAYDNGKVEVIELACGDELTDSIINDLQSPSVIKKAYNAQFERVCLSKYLNCPLDPSQWRCTMAHAAMCGLPVSLAKVAEVLNLKEQKMKAGKELIKFFSCPCKPTKSNGGRTRNYPYHDMERWKTFVEYNRQDVATEMEIAQYCNNHPISEFEKRIYEADQKINDLGIHLDMEMVMTILDYNNKYMGEMMLRAKTITGLDNPNSLTQLKNWIIKKGIPVTSLTKEDVKELIATVQEPDIKEVLQIRQELGKTSVSKYEAMARAVCNDDRVRGVLQYYGANRTGRWAGRLIQVQNLPQNKLTELDEVRQMVKEGDFETLECLYDSVSDVFSQLIRTAFVPKEGYCFVISDYSAIEARVIAWLAKETWRENLFKEGGDIYCQSASMMFKVPVIKHGINGHLRQKGKIAELACIAKGQLVDTDNGLVPIEKVTKKMKVWDGENYVAHDGIVYKGIKEVIEYEGIRATRDHIVWSEREHREILFGEAATSRTRLLRSGNSRGNLRKRKNYIFRKKMEQGVERSICKSKMRELWDSKVVPLLQLKIGEIKRMPALLTAKEGAKVVREKVYGGKAKMRKSKGREFQKLWRQRDKVLFPFTDRSSGLDDRKLRISRSKYGNRQNRYQWKLRAWKSKMGNPPAKLCEPTPVYDILNCGPNQRYSVNGILVHNCGYGGAKGALAKMGGEKMGLSETDMDEIVSAWRKANSNIVKLWKNVESCCKEAIENQSHTTIGRYGVGFIGYQGNLLIFLPSKRRLMYQQARVEDGKIKYMGMNQVSRKWESMDTYGGKLVENIVQAIARDCLALTMQRLQGAGYDIVMHIHDEVVVEVPAEKAEGHLKKIKEIMDSPISWAPNLILKAEAFISDYYKKD